MTDSLSILNLYECFPHSLTALSSTFVAISLRNIILLHSSDSTDETVYEINLHKSSVTALKFTTNGLLISLSLDYLIVSEFSTLKKQFVTVSQCFLPSLLSPLNIHAKPFTFILPSFSLSVLALCLDSLIVIIDFSHNCRVATVLDSQTNHSIIDLCFDPNNPDLVAAIYSDNSLLFWNISLPALLFNFGIISGPPLSCITFINNNCIIGNVAGIIFNYKILNLSTLPALISTIDLSNLLNFNHEIKINSFKTSNEIPIARAKPWKSSTIGHLTSEDKFNNEPTFNSMSLINLICLNSYHCLAIFSTKILVFNINSMTRVVDFSLPSSYSPLSNFDLFFDSLSNIINLVYSSTLSGKPVVVSSKFEIEKQSNLMENIVENSSPSSAPEFSIFPHIPPSHGSILSTVPPPLVSVPEPPRPKHRNRLVSVSSAGTLDSKGKVRDFPIALRVGTIKSSGYGGSIPRISKTKPSKPRVEPPLPPSCDFSWSFNSFISNLNQPILRLIPGPNTGNKFYGLFGDGTVNTISAQKIPKITAFVPHQNHNHRVDPQGADLSATCHYVGSCLAGAFSLWSATSDSCKEVLKVKFYIKLNGFFIKFKLSTVIFSFSIGQYYNDLNQSINRSSQKCIHSINFQSNICALATWPMVSSQYMISSTTDKKINLIDLNSGTIVSSFSSLHSRNICSLGVFDYQNNSPLSYNTVASCAPDSSCRLWDLRTRGCVFYLAEHKAKSSYPQVSIHQNSAYVAIGGDDYGSIYDLRQGKVVNLIRAPRQASQITNAVSFHSNNNIVASGGVSDLNFFKGN
ncbi:hypothetical protein RCL1_004199 [Eukaryota sp. TZLM3-RCL]